MTFWLSLRRTRLARHRISDVFRPNGPHRSHQSTETPPTRSRQDSHTDRTRIVHSTPGLFYTNRNISKAGLKLQSGIERDELLLEPLGPLSSSDLEVQRRLLAPGCDPTQILRQSIAARTATVHVVRLCLEKQFAELRAIPRRERQSVAKSQCGIAAVVLDHILRDPQLWVPFFMHCPGGQLQVSYYAILQGIDDRILEWLHTELRGEQKNVRNVWRGSLLRNMVEAHMMHEVQHNQDPAVQCFLRVCAQQKIAHSQYTESHAEDPSVPKPGILCTNLLPTFHMLPDRLTRTENHNTNPKLYTQLVERFASPDQYTTPRLQAEVDIDVACLLLYYPTWPKETAAMRLLQSFAAGKLDALPDRITTPLGALYFKRFLQRTLDVLLANNNSTDAEWLKQKFHLLADPTTGNFADPTRIRRPGEGLGRSKRGGRTKKNSAEPIPFPTFN